MRGDPCPILKMGGKIYESEGREDTRRPWSTESLKQGLHGLTETEVANMGPA